MALNTVKITIQGDSALLMHAFPLEPIERIEKKSIEEQAEYAAYRDPNTKELYIPGTAVQRALIGGATYSKGKGRGSLQKPAAACIQINTERLGLGTKSYTIDSRPVVIAATKGRIIRHRPRLDKWSVAFELSFDPDLLKESEIRRIVEDTGKRVGLLDFRPEKKGPFGRFSIIKWEA